MTETRVAPWHLAGAALACAFIAYFHLTRGWVPVLDDANLVFHEAGHPIFGLLGDTLGLYGGTLFQLLLPGAFVFSFLRRGDFFAGALCGIWFFENFFNVSRYCADARSRLLPLVGGRGSRLDEHPRQLAPPAS